MEYWVAVLGATAVYHVPTFSTKVKWLRNTPFWSRAESSICTWILCVRHQGRSTQRGKAAALLRPIPLSRRCLTIRRFGEYPKWKFGLLRIQGNVKLTEEVKKCWSADFLRTFLPINRFGDNNSTILHARETEASARTYDKKMATTSTPPVIVPNHCNSLHVAPTPTRAGREDLLLDRTIRCCRWCRCRCRWSAVHPGTLGCAGSSATLPFRSEGQQTSQGTSTFVIPPSDRNAPAKAHVPHFLREACSCTLDCPGCSTQVLPQKPSKNASCQIRQLLRYAA